MKYPSLKIKNWAVNLNTLAMDTLGLYERPVGVNIVRTVDGIMLTTEWHRYDVNILPWGGTFTSKMLVVTLDLQGSYRLEETDRKGYWQMEAIQ